MTSHLELAHRLRRNRIMPVVTAFDHTTRWGVVSQWKFNNDGLDAVGSNNLTNVNTATFGTGKIGQATNLVAASSQYWSHTDNSDLGTGAVDFWLSLWVKPATVDAVFRGLVTKYDGAGQSEYALYQADSIKWRFGISSDGTNVTTQVDSSITPSAGVWTNLFAYYDAVNTSIGIAGDGGSFVTATGVTAPTHRTAPVWIGNLVGLYENGLIDNVLFGKSPPLGIAALATEIRDGLYASGAGRESLTF